MKKLIVLVLLLVLLYGNVSSNFDASENFDFGGCQIVTDYENTILIITDYDSPLLANGPVDPQGNLVFGQTGNFSLEEVPVNVTGEGPVVFVVRPAVR